MKGNFDLCLELMLKHEGGYVHHSQDPGGRTNLGVTQRVWEEWTGHEVDEKQMRALTPTMVAPLYKRKYWDAIRGDELVSGVDYCVFDVAVNSGPGRAIKFLQSCVGVTVDGGFGPRTLDAVNEQDPSELIELYCAKRLEFLQSLKTFETFGRGWSRRVAEVKQVALEMVPQDTAPNA
jgi:lysozyme family protein